MLGSLNARWVTSLLRMFDVVPELGVSPINFPHEPPVFHLVYVTAVLAACSRILGSSKQLECHFR